MIVDVIAHILDQFRDKVCANRFMFAALNGNPTWSVISCIGANSRQRFSLQSENERWTELECSSFERRLDHANRCIVLPKAVSGFSRSFLLGVFD